MLNFKHVPKCLAGAGPREIVDLGADSHKVKCFTGLKSHWTADAIAGLG